MGQSFTDPVFQTEWKHKKEFPWCLNCHAPLQDQQPLIVDGLSSITPPTATGERNPNFDPTLQSEGVTCVVCHQQGDAIRVPHTDVQAPHKVIHDPSLATPHTCESCHQMNILPFTRVERPLTDTHAEWEEWKAKSGRSEDCLDCHMPSITRPVVTGGVPREGRVHSFVGAWDEATVRSAVSIGTPRRVNNTVEIDLENQTGHRFPSGEPARVLWVRLTLKDSYGRTLTTPVEKLHRKIKTPGAYEKEDTTLDPLERRTVRFEVEDSMASKVHAAHLEVGFDRFGNLESILPELSLLDLERQIILAQRPVPW